MGVCLLAWSCRIRRGMRFLGCLLSFFWRFVVLRRSPVGAVAMTARAHDCGPEPSLRTSPLSSLLRPTAAAFRFPRAHQGCAPARQPQRRAAAVLGRCAARPVCNGESCAARQIAAARAATIGIHVDRRRRAGRLRGCRGCDHFRPPH
ncbi:hypothetical protein G6F22_017992 [Rhizopus arrhizus]|nr:hypothetical protein G6F22_017992 [Rhizopus arrhizus]